MRKQAKYQETKEYYPLKMRDGWHVVQKIERWPPVEYDFDFMIVNSGEEARRLVGSLNTGRTPQDAE